MRSLTTTTFPTALNDESPLVAYFSATWCVPCKTFAPVVDEVAASHPEITFAKVDIDDEDELAFSHRIQGVPTLILFDHTTEAGRLSGAHPKSVVEKFLRDHTPTSAVE